MLLLVVPMPPVSAHAARTYAPRAPPRHRAVPHRADHGAWSYAVPLRVHTADPRPGAGVVLSVGGTGGQRQGFRRGTCPDLLPGWVGCVLLVGLGGLCSWVGLGGLCLWVVFVGEGWVGLGGLCSWVGTEEA
jgi:hypothetical protein